MSRLIAITHPTKVLKKGDSITSVFRPSEGPWTFQSVTHPRKLFVTQKDDPNGPDSWPNMASREFYASVFDAGIWDIDAEEWTFRPEWAEEYISELENILRSGIKGDAR